MKTKFALAFYYLAIGLLTACAIVIVAKLIFWPPCTKMGNTCVIDPWSVAGLAATILGVAGTILAVFGAVAVAAWWTMLNKRVSDQVTKLYGRQKREVNTQVDTLLAEQKQKIDTQLFQLGEELKQLRQGAEDVEDITIDGLMAIGAPSLEAWAQKAIQKKRIPHLPLRMATGYLDSIQYGLPSAEQELKKQKVQINQEMQTAHQLLNEAMTDIDLYSHKRLKEEAMQKIFHLWISSETKIAKEPKLFEYWNQAAYWLNQAKQEEDHQTCEQIEKRLEGYRSYIENLKQEYEQLLTEILKKQDWLARFSNFAVSQNPLKTDETK